jgi:DNA polymerase (family X)
MVSSQNGRTRNRRSRPRQAARAIHQLVKIPGLGPERARKLHIHLGISNIDQLRRALLDGRAAGLLGFRERMADRLLRAIAILARPSPHPLKR